MDLIVAVCRTLANRARLRLLRAIHAQPDITVQALASATALLVPEVSKHLKMLGGFHLIRARPQGRFVHYAPAGPGSASHPFLQDMQSLVRDMFGSATSNSTLRKVWNFTPSPEVAAEEELFMKLFTTYTHLRRLMILRCLLQAGPLSTDQLAGRLKMSGPAMHRHLNKLQRRAVVTVTAKRPQVWCLARPTDFAFRRQLLDNVLRSLKPTTGRRIEKRNSTLS